MSKTIPMWAAVMNRAVHRLRAQGQQQPQQPAAGAEPAGSSSSSSSSAWDCDVHLPPWVSEVEAHNIRQRLDGWVDALLEVRRFVWLGFHAAAQAQLEGDCN